MRRLSVLFLACLLFLPVFSFGADLHEDQLNRGIKETEPYSYLLMQQSGADPANAETLLKEARKYSPNLPAVYFELSKENLSLNARGMFETFDYLRQGLDAYKRNFWWSFMLASSLFTSLVVSFLVSIFIIVIIRVPKDVPLFLHDIKESKNRLLLLLMFVFALLGPLYLLGCLLMLISFYRVKWDRVVFYIYILFLISSPLLLYMFSLVFSSSSSGEFKAVVEVNESKGNIYALSLLGNRKGPDDLFSYALALKRTGKYEQAIEIYDRLIRSDPNPLVYNNLANCYFAMNDFERAKELYLKAKDLKPLPSALYNLSQAYRETLDFNRGEENFLAAQALNREAVSQYRAIVGRNPNRIVIDETLSFPALLRHARNRVVRSSSFGLSVLPPLFIPVVALIMLIFFIISDRSFRSWAYRCTRCGKILCSRCEKHILWGHMCLQCYRSMVKIEELDSRERIARLLAVYEHRQKRRSVIKFFSFLLPGVPQIYAGKVLQGFLFLWPFIFFIFIPVFDSFFSMEMSGFSHVWLNILSLIFLTITYVLSNILTRRRIAKGWL
jgi:tetratricopeptide (TPR) repeat protein